MVFFFDQSPCVPLRDFVDVPRAHRFQQRRQHPGLPAYPRGGVLSEEVLHVVAAEVVRVGLIPRHPLPPYLREVVFLRDRHLSNKHNTQITWCLVRHNRSVFSCYVFNAGCAKYVCVCRFPKPSSPVGCLWGPTVIRDFVFMCAVAVPAVTVAVAVVGDEDDDVDVAVVFIFKTVLSWYQCYQHALL